MLNRMGVSAEILRNVQAAMQAKDPVSEAFWKAKHVEIKALTTAGVIKQLPVEPQLQAPEIPVEVETAPKVDLRQQTFELLYRVVEPSAEEKEALRAKRGLVFLPMRSQSYAQVVAESTTHFWDNELVYANSRQAIRDYTPPVAVEVGLIERELALPVSFRESRAIALQMIEEYSQGLQTEFPDFRAIMLPATGFASVDRAYTQRNPGQVLFKNYFAWCLDDLSGVCAAVAGRIAPDFPFYVNDWSVDGGTRDVKAVPAVIKIGSK